MSFLNSKTKSTVLITGGHSGIGFALGKRLIALGHTVIAAGRRQTQLDLAKEQLPTLNVIQADVGTDSGRIELFEKVIRGFPEVNVLINSAAIVHFGLLIADMTLEDLQKHKAATEINLYAPIHLASLFLPTFKKQQSKALIVNLTATAVFHPYAAAAIGCGMKGMP